MVTDGTVTIHSYDIRRYLYYKTRQPCKMRLVHWYQKHSSFTFLCKIRLVHWYSSVVKGYQIQENPNSSVKKGPFELTNGPVENSCSKFSFPT